MTALLLWFFLLMSGLNVACALWDVTVSKAPWPRYDEITQATKMDAKEMREKRAELACVKAVIYAILALLCAYALWA